MTNTAERTHYYSETEAGSLGPGTQFGFNLAQWEVDSALFFFTVDLYIGGKFTH